MNDSARERPVLLVLDVVDGGRDDPAYEDKLNELTAGVLRAAADSGFLVDRVAAGSLPAGDRADRVTSADALIVMGGEDVDPALYGGDVDDPRVGQTFPAADRAQVDLIRAAVAAGRPVVGICRGMQIVNVALGGTLVPHLEGDAHVNPGSVADCMVDHDITVEPDSAMARVFGATQLTVRSAHHQAVDRLGPELRVTARAEDGTIEALEHVSAPLWCVQWHPEDVGAQGTVLTDLLTLAHDAIDRTGSPRPQGASVSG
ncbi:gamma-glutamyl-gamma-aminobutyrate hydrolase family protein [Microbacterium enclense]|uniref:gamma-glutamyl-gamma-aminobutyrate hydrolase family protein n=1 Tax=Microbacterium enclense TaxID=993073 RepID=UPI0036D9A158